MFMFLSLPLAKKINKKVFEKRKKNNKEALYVLMRKDF